MRIPFVPQLEENSLSPQQIRLIQASRGGSPFLFAGALFWILAGIGGWSLPPASATKVYLFGGLSVPFVGFLVARLQRATFPRSQFTILAAIAPSLTAFLLPLLFVLAGRDPLLVAPALTMIDAAHMPVLMWLHMDYTYFLAACAKIVIGLLFLMSFPTTALVGVGLLSGCISLLAAGLVWRASRDPLRPYLNKRGSVGSPGG